MEQRIVIKKWNMDWGFLIKNYLNPEMWEKVWTLFQYKEYKVTINIYSILTKSEQISFEVRTHYVTKNGYSTYKEETVYCSLKIEDVSFLKRKINSAIFKTIISVEKESMIEQSDEYNLLFNLKQKEYDRLFNIATKFLDSNNISSESIRDAYTDAYIDEYSNVPSMMSSYIDSKRYTMLTDFYLIWLDSIDSEYKENRIEDIKNNLTSEEYDNVMKEVKEYEEYMETDDYEDEMSSKLEEV